MQVLREQDFEYFKSGIIPSVQPTHAAIGYVLGRGKIRKDRVKNAYAYKKLLKKSIIA
jgi:predicted amidohydrolase YtcJ